MHSYLKYKEFYERKSRAAPLKGSDHCFVLQPKADHQGSQIFFRDYCWVGPFIVQKILPNGNYKIRRLKTNKTQILRCIRLKILVPNQPFEDRLREGKLQQDEEIIIPQCDLHTIAWEADFGEQPESRGNAPDPTHLPSGKQPVTTKGEPSDADEDEYIT